MNRRFLLLVGLALLSGCATAPPPVVAPAGHPLGELEPLYAVRAGPDALTITVSSNGCTRKEDFAFFVERHGAAARVAFGRKQLDRCQSFAPGKAELAFTWAELGVQGASPLFLLNPVTGWTGPGAL